MNSINLPVSTIEVKAEKRQLRAEWSTEMAHDLQSYHGLDIIDSFTKELGRQMRATKRKEKIENLFS
jgi:hypothetical protein